MTELITKRLRADVRWQLMATVSALALTAYVSSAGVANSEEADRPTVWVELGGQLSRLQNNQEIYAPPFVALTPSNLTPPQAAERSMLYGFDEGGKISFQPDNSDWIFSASVRYGRTSSNKHIRHQSHPGLFTTHGRGHSSYYGITYNYSFSGQVTPIAARFTDALVKESESHSVVDFQAGRDLGLGLFGKNSSSLLSVGVRFAQFVSKSRTVLEEDPDWRFRTHLFTFHVQGTYYSRYFSQTKVGQPYHSFAGTFRADRSFSGLGPSLSWNSSVPFAGDSESRSLSIDWGVNVAVLIGRQKAKTHHQTTARYHEGVVGQFGGTPAGTHATLYQNPATPDHTRSRNIVVPNIGAFAGLSFKYTNAKVSFGYKADFFFGAMDGGIDTRKTYDRGFYGPFATISIGLGG